MRELAVAQKKVVDEQGDLHTYDYSVLIGEMQVSDGFACESYGVRLRERGGVCLDVPDITVSVERIDELMDLLVDGAVTPCTLRDVVEDWL